MAIVTTNDQHYTAIAEAIRDKGQSGSFTPSEMAGAIEAIDTMPPRPKFCVPPDRPDIWTLYEQDDSPNKTYITVDSYYFGKYGCKNEMTFASTVVGQYDCGYVKDGEFVPLLEYHVDFNAHELRNCMLPLHPEKRFIVIRIAANIYSHTLNIPAVDIVTRSITLSLSGQSYVNTLETLKAVSFSPDTSTNRNKLIYFDMSESNYHINYDSYFKGWKCLESLILPRASVSSDNSPGYNSLRYAFQSNTIMFELDLSGTRVDRARLLYGCFLDCTWLTTLNLRSCVFCSVLDATDAFKNCSHLTNVITNDETWLPTRPLSFAQSSTLTNESLVNIANALAHTSSGALTLTLHNTSKTKLGQINGTYASCKRTYSETDLANSHVAIVDNAKFTAVHNTAGEYLYTYNGTNWLDEDGNTADFDVLGITLTGAKENGKTVRVFVKDDTRFTPSEGGTITLLNYINNVKGWTVA